MLQMVCRPKKTLPAPINTTLGPFTQFLSRNGQMLFTDDGPTISERRANFKMEFSSCSRILDNPSDLHWLRSCRGYRKLEQPNQFIHVPAIPVFQ